MSDINDHAAAIVTQLNTVLPVGRKAYRPGEIAAIATEPASYTVVYVSRTYVESYRVDGYPGVDRYRATVRHVGDTEFNAAKQAGSERTALEYVSLSIGGKATTPIRFETEQPIGVDEGRYVGDADWTYVL